MDRQDRADAMWLAENWSSLTHDATTAAHPRVIRQAHREAQADTPPSPSLHIETPTRITAGIEVVVPLGPST